MGQEEDLISREAGSEEFTNIETEKKKDQGGDGEAEPASQANIYIFFLGIRDVPAKRKSKV